MRAAGAVLLLIAVFAALACKGPEPSPTSPAERYQSNPAALRRGRLLFNGTCGGYCHPTKPGSRDAPYLFDCTWQHGGSDLEIFASIADGVPGTRMPAWRGKLPEGDEDIWKLVAYLRSQRSCAQESLSLSPSQPACARRSSVPADSRFNAERETCS